MFELTIEDGLELIAFAALATWFLFFTALVCQCCRNEAKEDYIA